MEISLGFIVILFLILFPGLIFRRLYYYGEFSKQFNSGLNVVSLLAISSVPGILLLITSYHFYCFFINSIDIAGIIDSLKDLNNPDYRLLEEKRISFKILFEEKISPFVAFLYLTSFLFGGVAGRLIRISRLDTRFKLLRFKNYWFYLFNGEHTSFRKMRHLKAENKKHLFTKADVLIESSSENLLYSGIIVDYELDGNDSRNLSKLMLQNAQRYSLKQGSRVAVDIPGTLLVVDCSSLKNINLTHIYEDTTDILKSKTPNTIEVLFGILIIILIPISIFQFDSIKWSFYLSYFNLPWYLRIAAFLLIVQVFSLCNPFVKRKDEYHWITVKELIAKGIWIVLLVIILLLFS
jgi:hypothetical protein